MSSPRSQLRWLSSVIPAEGCLTQPEGPHRGLSKTAKVCSALDSLVGRVYVLKESQVKLKSLLCSDAQRKEIAKLYEQHQEFRQLYDTRIVNDTLCISQLEAKTLLAQHGIDPAAEPDLASRWSIRWSKCWGKAEEKKTRVVMQWYGVLSTLYTND